MQEQGNFEVNITQNSPVIFMRCFYGKWHWGVSAGRGDTSKSSSQEAYSLAEKEATVKIGQWICLFGGSGSGEDYAGASGAHRSGQDSISSREI